MNSFKSTSLGLLLISNIAIVAQSFAVVAPPSQVTISPTNTSIQFFKRQVSNSTSLTNALNSLIDRYPHRTTEFVSIALSAYPEQYNEIIMASVRKQPMFVDEIIIVANDYDVAKPTEILEIAITAEPSYASAATRAACQYSPESFQDIVRMAVSTEPDSADQIAQKLVDEFPTQTMEILITTIKEVPYVGKYVLDALLAALVDDEQASKDVIIVSIEQLVDYPDAIDRLVEIAKERDIEASDVRQSALKGGISESEIAMIIKKYY